MAYVALKPCRFAGQSFRIGESVPAEVIQPGAAKNLVKMGIIAEESAATMAAAPEETQRKITVTIHAEEGDMPLEPTEEGLQALFDVITSNVAKAEPIIEGMKDGDALILLDLADNRKSVKELARTRAQEINAPEESEGEA